jgi:hypothetical protein
MVVSRGGLETAPYLLHADTISDGYAALCERNRLDLAVEHLVLDSKWRPLFTTAERQVAVKRLREYGFSVSCPMSTPNEGAKPR